MYLHPCYIPSEKYKKKITKIIINKITINKIPNKSNLILTTYPIKINHLITPHPTPYPLPPTRGPHLPYLTTTYPHNIYTHILTKEKATISNPKKRKESRSKKNFHFHHHHRLHAAISVRPTTAAITPSPPSSSSQNHRRSSNSSPLPSSFRRPTTAAVTPSPPSPSLL